MAHIDGAPGQASRPWKPQPASFFTAAACQDAALPTERGVSQATGRYDASWPATRRRRTSTTVNHGESAEASRTWPHPHNAGQWSGLRSYTSRAMELVAPTPGGCLATPARALHLGAATTSNPKLPNALSMYTELGRVRSAQAVWKTWCRGDESSPLCAGRGICDRPSSFPRRRRHAARCKRDPEWYCTARAMMRPSQATTTPLPCTRLGPSDLAACGRTWGPCMRHRPARNGRRGFAPSGALNGSSEESYPQADCAVNLGVAWANQRTRR